MRSLKKIKIRDSTIAPTILDLLNFTHYTQASSFVYFRINCLCRFYNHVKISHYNYHKFVKLWKFANSKRLAAVHILYLSRPLDVWLIYLYVNCNKVRIFINKRSVTSLMLGESKPDNFVCDMNQLYEITRNFRVCVYIFNTRYESTRP